MLPIDGAAVLTSARARQLTRIVMTARATADFWGFFRFYLRNFERAIFGFLPAIFLKSAFESDFRGGIVSSFNSWVVVVLESFFHHHKRWQRFMSVTVIFAAKRNFLDSAAAIIITSIADLYFITDVMIKILYYIRILSICLCRLTSFFMGLCVFYCNMLSRSCCSWIWASIVRIFSSMTSSLSVRRLYS